MSDLSPDDTQTLIAYARQKFAEERYRLSPALLPVREAIEKLKSKPELPPAPPKSFEPNTVLQKRRW